MGNRQRETLAQPAATLLPIMAARSRPHSPYHDRARTGTESLPNLNSPRLSSISDAPDTLPRHLEYPSGWLSSRFSNDPLPPIRPAAVPASVQHPTCTHCTMTRKFDDDGNETCDICRRKSAFGWLYVCTEDHDGFLPADNEYSSTLCRESCDSDTTGEISLSPWIKKAIEHGQYTTDQIEILKLQRAEVEEAVSIARNPTPTSSVTHISESSSYIEDTDDEAWTETVEDTSQPDTESEPEDSRPGISGPQVDRIRPRAHPVCRLMCCHSCRPACRDRSWASLNAVCNETHVKPPPPWDISNRRVSDTKVVRQLGLDKAETNRPFRSDGSPRSTELLKQSNSHGHGATNTERSDQRLLAVTPSAHGKFEKIRRSTEKKVSHHDERSQIQSRDTVARGSPRRGIDLIRKNRPLGSTSDQQPTASGGEPTDIGHDAEFQTGPTSSKSRRPSLDSEFDSEVDVPGGVALTEEGVTTEKADLVTDKELDV